MSLDQKLFTYFENCFYFKTIIMDSWEYQNEIERD